MSKKNFKSIRAGDGVQLFPPLGPAEWTRISRTSGLALPDDHLEALMESNGALVFGGYARLLGVGDNSSLDIATWNEGDYWKFAWKNRCSDYLCFAETAWGDQYAYKTSALLTGDNQVYFLDSLSMTPVRIAVNFSEFFEQELLRIAEKPYDVFIPQARVKLGDLNIDEHIVYAPSPLLGAVEDLSNIQKMPARWAMVCNGDIACQLDDGPVDGIVSGATTSIDQNGLMRIKLEWS